MNAPLELVARRTVWPWAASRSARVEPIWPLAPITRVVVMKKTPCVVERALSVFAIGRNMNA